MPEDVDRALATPYDLPLTFRTEVRPYLYLASAGLTALGLIFIGFSFTPDAGLVGILAAAMGTFMLYIAWVNFWTTRAGYPHLILIGHRLTEQSSDAFRRDLDLTQLGDTKIVILTGGKGSQRLYLGFLPLPGKSPPARRFVAPKLAQFADSILLNGYTGNNPTRAKAIERVVNTRRLAPAQDIALPPIATDQQRAARLRLIATGAVFAAGLVALLVWRAIG
ncbi:MAG: hypothetical protein ABIQ30_12200 [Devosia sp.]